jgi:hypothetical protein
VTAAAAAGLVQAGAPPAASAADLTSAALSQRAVLLGMMKHGPGAAGPLSAVLVGGAPLAMGGAGAARGAAVGQHQLRLKRPLSGQRGASREGGAMQADAGATSSMEQEEEEWEEPEERDDESQDPHWMPRMRRRATGGGPVRLPSRAARPPSAPAGGPVGGRTTRLQLVGCTPALGGFVSRTESLRGARGRRPVGEPLLPRSGLVSAGMGAAGFAGAPAGLRRLSSEPSMLPSHMVSGGGGLHGSPELSTVEAPASHILATALPGDGGSGGGEVPRRPLFASLSDASTATAQAAGGGRGCGAVVLGQGTGLHWAGSGVGVAAWPVTAHTWEEESEGCVEVAVLEVELGPDGEVVLFPGRPHAAGSPAVCDPGGSADGGAAPYGPSPTMLSERRLLASAVASAPFNLPPAYLPPSPELPPPGVGGYASGMRPTPMLLESVQYWRPSSPVLLINEGTLMLEARHTASVDDGESASESEAPPPAAASGQAAAPYAGGLASTSGGGGRCSGGGTVPVADVFHCAGTSSGMYGAPAGSCNGNAGALFPPLGLYFGTLASGSSRSLSAPFHTWAVCTRGDAVPAGASPLPGHTVQQAYAAVQQAPGCLLSEAGSSHPLPQMQAQALQHAPLSLGPQCYPSEAGGATWPAPVTTQQPHHGRW